MGIDTLSAMILLAEVIDFRRFPRPGELTWGWCVQQRLHRRYRHFVGRGKRPPGSVTAITRADGRTGAGPVKITLDGRSFHISAVEGENTVRGLWFATGTASTPGTVFGVVRFAGDVARTEPPLR